jgi:uncharacterized lipoprotein
MKRSEVRPLQSRTLVIALALLLGCDSKSTTEGAPAAASSSDPSAPGAKPSAKPKPKFPPQARRNSAPAGIEQSALAVGRPAPPLEGIDSTIGSWSRSREGFTVLVFYRGHW